MTSGDRIPVALFGAIAAASVITLLVLAHPLSFIYDEWDFLLDRSAWNADAFLQPHNEHLSLLPVLAYKVGVAAFGMSSQLPFQVLLTGSVLAVAVLVFVWVRRRVGAWLALAAVVPLAFFGAGAIDVLAWGPLIRRRSTRSSTRRSSSSTALPRRSRACSGSSSGSTGMRSIV